MIKKLLGKNMKALVVIPHYVSFVSMDDTYTYMHTQIFIAGFGLRTRMWLPTKSILKDLRPIIDVFVKTSSQCGLYILLV